MTAVADETVIRALDTWPSRWDLLGVEYEMRRVPRMSADVTISSTVMLYAPLWLAVLFNYAARTDPPVKRRERTEWERAQKARDDFSLWAQQVRAVLDALQAQPDVYLGLDDVLAVAGLDGVIATYKGLLPADPGAPRGL